MSKTVASKSPAVVPDGFAPHFRKSPLTRPWEPLYSMSLADRVVIGLEVRTAHCNSRGLLHGGLISALADNAMGLSCMAVLETRGETQIKSMVTVSLHVDFLGQAKVGQWLAFITHYVKVGRTLSFTNAFVTADGDNIARAAATFRALTQTPKT
jgi:uncharacterized protein (TIGR00369 family)